MDEASKKTALRMVPYGMFVLTSKSKDGKSEHATVSSNSETFLMPGTTVAIAGLSRQNRSATCDRVVKGPFLKKASFLDRAKSRATSESGFTSRSIESTSAPAA